MWIFNVSVVCRNVFFWRPSCFFTREVNGPCDVLRDVSFRLSPQVPLSVSWSWWSAALFWRCWAPGCWWSSSLTVCRLIADVYQLYHSIICKRYDRICGFVVVVGLEGVERVRVQDWWVPVWQSVSLWSICMCADRHFYLTTDIFIKNIVSQIIEDYNFQTDRQIDLYLYLISQQQRSVKEYKWE